MLQRAGTRLLLDSQNDLILIAWRSVMSQRGYNNIYSWYQCKINSSIDHLPPTQNLLAGLETLIWNGNSGFKVMMTPIGLPCMCLPHCSTPCSLTGREQSCKLCRLHAAAVQIRCASSVTNVQPKNQNIPVNRVSLSTTHTLPGSLSTYSFPMWTLYGAGDILILRYASQWSNDNIGWRLWSDLW